tara:strand:+ start:2343 stop:3197 length:855 start_codon:yes stop_codon:yes gene_type:complete
MSSQTKNNKVFQYIIDALEKGTVPWRSPYKPMVSGHGHVYTGVNRMVLNMEARLKEYTSRTWYTYKGAKKNGGTVCKGEKGTPIIYYSQGTKENKEGEQQFWLVRKVYYVFNKDQCDFWEDESEAEEEWAPTWSGDTIVGAYVTNNPELKITHVPGMAYYAPKKDVVNVPMPRELEAGMYYPTMFHELAHSTGAKHRLDRSGITDINMHGDHAYSEEELVAEMTTAYLCGYANFQMEMLDQSAAYIKGWMKGIKDDPNILQRAASMAEKAFDYIVQTNKGDDNG